MPLSRRPIFLCCRLTLVLAAVYLMWYFFTHPKRAVIPRSSTGRVSAMPGMVPLLRLRRLVARPVNDGSDDAIMPAPASATYDETALRLLWASLCVTFTAANVLSPNLTRMAEEFDYDEGDRDRFLGAYLSLALGVVPLPVAAAIGALADCWERRLLLVWCLAFGSAASLATAVASQFWVIFALRAVTGAALGGALPVAFSLMADLFPAEVRNRCSVALTAAMGVGILLGQVVAGVLGPSLGWRGPVALCAAPGVVLAAVVHAFLIEPPRGGHDDYPHASADSDGGGSAFVSPPSAGFKVIASASAGTKPGGDRRSSEGGGGSAGGSSGGILAALRVRTNLLLSLQGLPGSVPLGIMFAFLGDFLTQEKGLSAQSATLLVVTFGTGAAAGGVGGGMAGAAAYRLAKPLLPLLCGAASAAAAMPMLAVLHLDYAITSSALLHACAFAAGALSSVSAAPVRAMLLNVNPPEGRGAALALASTFAGLGRGLGPLAAGWMVPSAAAPGADDALLLELAATGGGGDGGRIEAMTRSMVFWAVGGVLLALAAFTLSDDEVTAASRGKRGTQYAPVPEGENWECDLENGKLILTPCRFKGAAGRTHAQMAAPLAEAWVPSPMSPPRRAPVRNTARPSYLAPLWVEVGDGGAAVSCNCCSGGCGGGGCGGRTSARGMSSPNTPTPELTPRNDSSAPSSSISWREEEADAAAPETAALGSGCEGGAFLGINAGCTYARGSNGSWDTTAAAAMHHRRPHAV
ncbi:unnamed protein product [Phaeothamnion confervicola]